MMFLLCFVHSGIAVSEGAIAQVLKSRDLGEADQRLDAVAFGFMPGALVAAAGFIAGATLA